VIDVPAKELSPIEIYKYLPKTNCKECGETNCMAFAAKLVNREAALQECLPLLDPKQTETYSKLWALLKPSVKAVEIGSENKKRKIGGEYVQFRHEFTYFSPTAIAIDVSDEMSDEEVEIRVKFVNELTYQYIGMTLTLDMVAIRCTSNDPAKFEATAKKVAQLTDKPLILCALEPAVMEQGLAAVGDKRPLIYAATKNNWKEMADLALMYKCPLVASSPQDLDTLKSLAKTLKEYGVDDIILDPGTLWDEGTSTTVNNHTILRDIAINEGDEDLGYPLLGVPMVAWSAHEEDHLVKEWNEAMLASVLVTRYTDIMILHSVSGWSLLPLIFLRQNLYTDPRKPVAVEAGVRAFGDVTDMSPVFLTTNFALTYYTVASDIESAKLSCHVLVVDSEGMSVESAVAGRKLTADTIAEAVKNFKLGDIVKHRHLVIPGRAARLSGEIQEATGWSVSVGPMDSSGIPKYLEEKWKPTVE
jgi:acetyl-CoA decarbonylase/synthase complex subunit gamma